MPPSDADFSQSKRAERLNERADQGLFATTSATKGHCPACGLMVLASERSVSTHAGEFHDRCVEPASRGDGRAQSRPERAGPIAADGRPR